MTVNHNVPAAMLPAGPTDSLLSQAEMDSSTYHSYLP